MTISEFVALLLDICPAVYHHEAFQEASEFIVWGEVGETYMHADNVRGEDGTLIAVDILTKKEFSDVPGRLKQIFRENEIIYKGPDIVYHPDTEYTQYAYTVELI